MRVKLTVPALRRNNQRRFRTKDAEGGRRTQMAGVAMGMPGMQVNTSSFIVGEAVDIEETAWAVVDSALRVHREVGPGLLESAYECMLAFELRERGCCVEQQKYLDLTYRHLKIERAYCLDLLVNDVVVVEIKAMERLAPVRARQLMTYLKASSKPLGLLLNFGRETLVGGGIKRILNRYTPPC